MHTTISKKMKLLGIGLCSFLIGCQSTSMPSDSLLTAENISTISTEAPTSDESYKILHVMSYHRGWEWTETQLEGFQSALSDLNIEYEIIALDAKNHSDAEWLNSEGAKARDFIETWQPDLVYTSDDEAQEYVATYYNNTELPFVFSTVNQSPEYYGFDKAKNVTGIYEIEHFSSTIDLLTNIVPDTKKIAVIYDESPIWKLVHQRLLSITAEITDLEFEFLDPIYTYKEYQEILLDLQDDVDAICQIGVFNFKDEQGNNVSFEEVLKWTEANSTLPDCSFWFNRVENGILCSVAISGYEQGYAAGLLAKEILVNDISPSELAHQPALKGQPSINLKRAKKLGLEIDSSILLSSTVLNTYDWEE